MKLYDTGIHVASSIETNEAIYVRMDDHHCWSIPLKATGKSDRPFVITIPFHEIEKLHTIANQRLWKGHHYGLRVGDIVTYPNHDPIKHTAYRVTQLCDIDNNRVWLESLDKRQHFTAVAEWCRKESK